VAKLNVTISDELDREFRAEVARRFGGEKGKLGKAISEAIELWLEEGELKYER